jgi:hypothetical protein
MKRSRSMVHNSADEEPEPTVSVRLGVQTRLGVLVPVDDIRRTVVPGLRSVYYCPQAFPGGSGLVVDGLVFELFVCAEPALTDEMLYKSLLWGYLGRMKHRPDPKGPEEFPHTPLGDALALVADGEDEHLLEVTTVPPGEAAALHVHKHKRFVDEKVVTRLARVRTRFHPLFLSIVDRLRNSDKLVRNRNDPSKRAEYNCLLLVAALTGKKTREGKWKGVPVSKLLPVADPLAPLSQLVDQLRLQIDDFERLSKYENARIIEHTLERAKRLAGNDFQELTPSGTLASDEQQRHFDPRDLSGFTPGSGSQFFASMPHSMLAPCHGAVVATSVAAPRAMVDPVLETHRLFGKRPWLLEHDVPSDTPKMRIDYALIRFQRTMALEGSTAALSFKSATQLLQELPPAPKKQKPTATPTIQTTLTHAVVPMQARLPANLDAMVRSVHIKTE